MKQDTKELLKQLAKKLKKEVGRKCGEEHYFCYTCQAWRAYNMLRECFK